jgi:hypothetical protein
VLVVSVSRGQRGDDLRVGERGSEPVVLLVERTARVSERLDLGAGFVAFEAVLARAFLGGGEVSREPFDPSLRDVGMWRDRSVAYGFAPCGGDWRAIRLLACEARLGGEVGDRELAICVLGVAGEESRHRGA